MRSAKALLKSLAILIASLFAVGVFALVAGTAWIIFSPGTAWRVIQRHVLPADLNIQATDGGLSLTRETWTRWNVTARIKNLRVTKATPRLALAVEDLTISVRLKPSPPYAEVTAVKISAPETAEYFNSPVSSQETTDYVQAFAKMMHYLQIARRHFRPESVDVEILDFRYHPTADGKPIVISFTLGRNSAGKGLDFRATVQNISHKIEKIFLEGETDLQTLGGGVPFLTCVTKMSGRSFHAEIPLSLAYADGQAKLSGTSELEIANEGKTIRAKSELSAIANTNGINIHLENAMQGIDRKGFRLGRQGLSWRIPFDAEGGWSSDPSEFEIEIPIAYVGSRSPIATIEKACACKLPFRVTPKLSGKLWMKRLFAKTSGQVLALEVQGLNLRNRLFDLKLAAAVSADLREGTWQLFPKLNSEFKLNDFQGVRRLLDAENILIPAPFAILNGTADLTANGPVNFVFHGARLETISTGVDLNTNLASKDQSIKLRIHAEIEAGSDFKQVEINIRTLIDRLEIQLPPYNPIGGAPKVLADRRLKRTPPSKSRKIPKFIINFSASTTSPGAVILHSNLAQPYIPLSLDVVSGEKNSGRIEVLPFKVVYLRRTLFVDSLVLEVPATFKKQMPLTGEFHVQQTDYKVLIHVGGTVESPQITLSSIPYLERADIISVLLYDRTRNQLVGGDSETVGNVQAAMADRAIGLFGLWAFAATPIRSFSYNPVTKVYSATIDLGNGVTAGIGSDLDDSARLAVRKRLSERWVVTASWVPVDPKAKAGSLGQVVLQWERRF